MAVHKRKKGEKKSIQRVNALFISQSKRKESEKKDKEEEEEEGVWGCVGYKKKK